ncbi:MAG: hypothetical protein COV08_03720 [Candidatus Vogelbacteria bacterium CG10_big_fil_rev_8_21_14_0_10_49_38]|uniref:Uncharacterized protein n=1 Tax=Candidatus Vogelbacteria bacterium CG10_big_fil_rev_8_21_14_0_10_49_38 TaxID=1975043 RepID=A0A2H0RI85_9BACT|nr:MAG: hypothetical protein BK006_03710 [bacterium CG10_49_38]PIR45744.1 MAG: hypothetical protein COV08_03720 [Candidatus Vogelbacteria bacterium CG10_big_fil_rev_8_21_14_0_10_49_38]
MSKLKFRLKKNLYRLFYLVLLLLAVFFVLSGFSAIWAITLPVPDFESFFTKQIAEQSTKIYDRTGEIMLYDVRGVRQTSVPFQEIPETIKKATLAIEDDGFYQHKGFQISSIIKAFWVNLLAGEVVQGGSTITQQVVKNSLLTRDRTLTRKVKELILSIKLEKSMTKDDIFNVYLNQSPYGGNLYGIKEAVKAYFHKDLNQITLAEAAYLAALPQRPNYYSPYGNNKDKLEKRKNLVLDRMLDVGYITKEEWAGAKKEEVVFYEKINQGIKAPHFVFWLLDQLNKKYGKENLETNNYKIISTIDWKTQQKVEELAKKYGEENEIKFKAQNNSVVIIDPKTGQIIALTGSRDYFNQEIEGSFNVAAAHRQPGSSFKPFVYATAFNKGYTDKTVVFDLKTEFSTSCRPNSQPLFAGAVCYSPRNYDAKYIGPVTLREALAQSRNVPAVKVLYLVGINDVIGLARKMGIESLTDAGRYGLTLVLGGGEVSLLDMVGAYGVFAADGVKHQTAGIIKIIGPKNDLIYEYKDKVEVVLPSNSARLISDILSDDEARAPLYGRNSLLQIPGRQVAVKTGTTNDYKDVWIIGYTPNLVIGAWAGNNDNTPMEKLTSGQIISPLWNAIAKEVLKTLPEERFAPPTVFYDNLKPILRGYWQGGETIKSNNQETLLVNVHSILYWINKSNPLGQSPINPQLDPQYKSWEYAVQNWLSGRNLTTGGRIKIEQQKDEQLKLMNQINFLSPNPTTPYQKESDIKISLSLPNGLNLNRVDYFINENKLITANQYPFEMFFNPLESQLNDGNNELKAVFYDQNQNTVIKTVIFTLNP